jgi:hypothetical protein
MRLKALTASIILASTLTGYSQEIMNAEQFRTWIRHDSVSYRWDDEKALAATQKIATEIFRSAPNDQYAPYLVFYLFHVLNRQTLENTTLGKADSARIFLEQYDRSFPKKGPLYWLAMANSYNYLELIYKRLGELEIQQQMIEQNISFLTAIFGSDPSSEFYQKAFWSLTGAYINKGSLLYFTTHHLDSKSKRNEVGPKIVKYYNLADSVIRIQDSKFSTKTPPKTLLTLALNQYVLYGAYLFQPEQTEIYRQRIVELLDTYCKEETNRYCDISKNSLTGSTAWIFFSEKKYPECIDVMRPFYTNLTSEGSAKAIGLYYFTLDAAFALTESYYSLGQTDSALYYGIRYLADTTALKDYYAMSEIASILSELYLDKDILRSKELLKLSKECIAKSQNSQAKGKLIREGEVIQLNQSFQRVMNVSEELKNRQYNQLKYILGGLFILLILATLAIVFFIRRIARSKAQV